MPIEVPLTQGYRALIDEEDWPLMRQYRWRAHVDRHKDGRIKKVYARGRLGGRDASSVLMHRLILRTPRGLETDHIDHDGLNNTRHNLRAVTTTEKQLHRRP